MHANWLTVMSGVCRTEDRPGAWDPEPHFPPARRSEESRWGRRLGRGRMMAAGYGLVLLVVGAALYKHLR